MILHLLRLITCTVSISKTDGVTLHWENDVGFLYTGQQAQQPDQGEEPPLTASNELLQKELQRPFALPSPAREALLSILISMLSNKGPLRSVSNASVYPEQITNTNDMETTADSDAPATRKLLILHWRVLLRMLLRTAPYLDERVPAKIAVDSSSRQSAVLKRTVQLIRDARHFFDQGIRPPPHDNNESLILDNTARQVWAMVETDALFHSHSHACYRATILLYLFLPSRSSSDFYNQVLPLWWEAWSNIDRCPEFDFLWLALFCRARKYCQYDWAAVRKRLLTNCQYWLQLPIGGASLDKSFPRAGNPRSRSCPPRLKVFVGSSSSYEEGIDFVAKVSKLLVAGLGVSSESANVEGNGSQTTLSDGTNDVLRFLSFATPYFNPSNLGSWTFTLGAFLHYFAYELACRVGAAAGLEALRKSHPLAAEAYEKVQPGPVARPIPPHEVVALLHALLPLCQQALYSKNGHVGRAAEAAMLYLVQMDPAHVTPSFMEFAIRALDIQAVNLSHQAPSALSALTRLVQPALRNSDVWLTRLPEMLRLSLAGVDGNDQNKTIRTLIFYRSLASWVPVGGGEEEWPTLEWKEDDEFISADGTMRLGKGLFRNLEQARKCKDYQDAVAALPESSLLKMQPANDPEMHGLIVSEAMSAMSDWALEFLDRVFGLLRASGEREKTGKTTSGVASRHSSADVHAARNFSRVLKESLMQLFAAMSDDVHRLAVRTVRRFLEEESLPAAAKDASFLCQAAAAMRESSKNPGHIASPGLESLLEVLIGDLEHHSTKTVVYRLRCLAGAVRQAGLGAIQHREKIAKAIEFALSSEDRHVFKTGCKLLRHTLATLSESYPILSESKPRAYSDGKTKYLGRSAQLHGDPVRWHIPNAECVDFIHELLSNHVVRRLDSFVEDTHETDNRIRSRMLNSTDVHRLRRCLRVVRYCIRGGASVLVDHFPGDTLEKENDFVPYEVAGRRLLALAPEATRNTILTLRMRLASFLVVLSAVVASDTLYPGAIEDLPENDPYRKTLPLISSDPKICKETSLIALLLLTRRGASFRSQEARTIWKAQKQLAADFSLSAQVDQMAETLQCSSLYSEGASILYKDGEDAGKTIPRRLLVGRVRLFHDSLQRNASFEVPRRLRRVDHHSSTDSRTVLFSVKKSLPEMLEYLETRLRGKTPRPLDAYEGISDGLCALCCHSNTQVRASAIGVIDYAVTRFAWLLGPRVPRLLSAVALEDEHMNGKFGFPSCAMLKNKTNQQGKRKRLAEAIKGVCSILSLGRSIKQLLVSEKMRLRFAKTICGTDGLLSLLPAEEVQKVVHYIHAVFSPFRSKVYYLPRVTASDRRKYAKTSAFANNILAEKRFDSNGDSESVAVHWRKLLLGCWFLLSLVDGDERDEQLQTQYDRTWATCLHIIETESGQPLQRVGLGLFGRLTFLAERTGDVRHIREKMATEAFCKVFTDALVFDHREDTSIGGGHDAQWSAGVEDVIRDASRNIAPRTLFPFQRTSQSTGSFKVSHSQLVECVLNVAGPDVAADACGHLLSSCKEMAAAPPSEDQRNYQITSAEVFAGVCGYYIRSSKGDCAAEWEHALLPYLDEVITKIPFALSSAYFDALRYALQFSAPKSFYLLTEWLVTKVLATLWQPKVEGYDDEGQNSSGHGTEGFTAQSKWLYLVSAILIEMDDSEVDGSMSRSSWYASQLLQDAPMESDMPNQDLEISWDMIVHRLLPRLTAALGHPFDSCRDHISRCLFRICYCHRKRERIGHSRSPSRSNSMVSLEGLAKMENDPGMSIIEKFTSLHQNEELTFHDKYNALSTARRFMSYCVHLGEAKFEYADYVIPLLPVAFEALASTMEDEEDTAHTSEENAAKRALEAEVIKAYRFMIAEVSVTAVISYGRGTDITRVIDAMDSSQRHAKWQVRHAIANFLRCFQGAHKFLFSAQQGNRTMDIVANLLADERREVSSAAMAALTGILAASPELDVAQLVDKYAVIAKRSKIKRQKKSALSDTAVATVDVEASRRKEERRAKNQQTSVFFLCAAVMSQPYETPSFVPSALAAISTHSFERNAPLGVRDTVKKCCAEYKRTHMSDNWGLHRNKFTQEQLEALEDVVSTPHYYA